ncbi:MAG: glutaredoxin 3 [Alphaproteobacteria bacterium]|nr:glutaredoxin 3 [Alphaproteobacteria bacterium]
MKQVEIYTTRFCGFCVAAKRLLAKKHVSYSEIDVGMQPKKRAEMMARANGGRSVPQIFIGGRHIGGCDELYELERSGRLNDLLAA